MDLEKIKLIIRELIILKDSTRNAVNKIMQDEKYAVDYRRELADQAKQKAAVSKNNLCDQAIEAIEAMKKEWLSGKSSMQKDQTFELQFGNTMKVIETIGEEMTTEELTELVRPFHEDYFIMKILRNLCIKKGIESITDIFGVDVIDSKVRELQELENIITQASRNNMDALNTMSLSIAIKMMEGKTV